jgi:hypothetical protein
MVREFWTRSRGSHVQAPPPPPEPAGSESWSGNRGLSARLGRRKMWEPSRYTDRCQFGCPCMGFSGGWLSSPRTIPAKVTCPAAFPSLTITQFPIPQCSYKEPCLGPLASPQPGPSPQMQPPN